MRKVESVEKREKKEKKRQQLLSGILIFVLLFSIAGYAAFSGTNKEKDNQRIYNGLSFNLENGFWKTMINEKELVFFSLPYDLGNISIEMDRIFSDYSEKPLYFVGSYPSTIPYNLDGIPIRMQNACIENHSCLDATLPIKNCSEDNLLIFIEGNDSTIYQKENCIYLEGDLMKVSDKFIYNLLGIEL